MSHGNGGLWLDFFEGEMKLIELEKHSDKENSFTSSIAKKQIEGVFLKLQVCQDGNSGENFDFIPCLCFKALWQTG